MARFTSRPGSRKALAGFIGVALFAALLGLGNGISAGVVMTIGSDFSPALGRPQFLAGWRLTTGLGQAAGPLLITLIAALAPLGLAAVAIGAIFCFVQKRHELAAVF